MSDKYYSLLRPFDLEAAKRGEAICTHSGNHLDFVAADKKNGSHCVRIGDWDYRSGRLSIRGEQHLRMAPLCWVEGKPVYKGDVLYSSFFAECDQRTENGNSAGRFVASGMLDGNYIEASERGSSANTHTEKCTWTPPMVKREGWVNIYPSCSSNRVADTSHVHVTREAADRQSISNRIDCVRIEWEEQP